jgi:hypothetical protein
MWRDDMNNTILYAASFDDLSYFTCDVDVSRASAFRFDIIDRFLINSHFYLPPNICLYLLKHEIYIFLY